MPRRSIPTEIKVIEGKLPPGAKNPVGAGPIGAPYPSMSPAAQEIWGELTEEWAVVLKRTDRQAMKIYCEARAELDEAMDRVAREGMTVMSRNGETISPWVRLVDIRRETCRKMLGEFFGTPSARGRQYVGDNDDGPFSPIAAKYGL